MLICYIPISNPRQAQLPSRDIHQTDVTYPSQFSWYRNPNWTAFYSSAPEIWQYFKDVAVKFDLLKYIKLRHKVESATWDEERGKWILVVTGPDGEIFEDECEILANGSGILK